MGRLVAGLLCGVLWCSGTAQGTAESGVFADSTFIQPTIEDARRTPDQWEALFAHMQAMGIRELVVQWTRYGDADLMPVAGIVMDMAARRGMKVWVGLYSPTDWWDAIKKSPQPLEVYLWQVMRTQLQQAETVWAAFGGHPALAGLYLPVEIDDGSWHDEARADLLRRVLRSFAERAGTVAPQALWAISGFSNGQVPPLALADFWRGVLNAGRLRRLYFQDGVGVFKLTPAEAAVYERALARTLLPVGDELMVVVEAFTQVGGPPVTDGAFVAVPAPLKRLERQVAYAREAGATGAAFFTVPNYMSFFGGSPAEALGRQWVYVLSRQGKQ